MGRLVGGKGRPLIAGVRTLWPEIIYAVDRDESESIESIRVAARPLIGLRFSALNILIS
jgi:hypothetical protein